MSPASRVRSSGTAIPEWWMQLGESARRLGQPLSGPHWLHNVGMPADAEVGFGSWPEWSIRRAAIVDAGALADLAREVFPLACPRWMDAETVARHIDASLSAAHFAADLSNPAMSIWVAEDAARTLIGYVMTVAGEAPEGWDAASTLEIRRIYLAAGWHGSGVGRDLMARAVEFARDGAYAAVWLGTSRENDRAIRFYLRQGFRIVGERTFMVADVPNRDHVLLKSVSRRR